jgi:hypothetical protein
MEIKTHYAIESLSPEDQIVSLGPTTYEPVTYAPSPLSSVQETKEPSYRDRRIKLKTRPAQVTTPVSQSSVQQNIQVQSNVQPVPASQVQPQVQVHSDPDPVVPNLGPSMFRRSSKRMPLNSNRITSTEPESSNPGVQTESPEITKLRRIRADSIWQGSLLMYCRRHNVKFNLSSLQLQELEKFDVEISNIRENTGRFDCKLLMKKFLLLESYNIPDVGGVYKDEVISKTFPMDLLRMILIKKGNNTDNLSKTQMINKLNSYDRTVLAFTMVSSEIWGPDV